MENVPESAKHVACEFFLDVELLCLVRNQAVFDFGEEVRIIKLDNSEVQAGEVGRLALFHTRHGERWQFRPYQSGNWRRVPDLDTPSRWTWRCIRTGEVTTTAIGTLPSHAPTAHPPSEDEHDGLSL
ncbi:hypothetical protein [Ralstonia mojiangensis]|uniref:hypothetical protein n=1 Tax=Ralstonia mojiangensis TaxID=2953895 RepID=UPI0021B418A3|nr:hypothetical protein [Ralstonia mojiangensis]MCT7325021.1 hypothetical protein [Ralstonia mojiangensis]